MTAMKTISATKDTYHFTIGTFYLIGILVYLPMQFFSTSTDYWMYKFRPPQGPPPDGPDDHGPCPPPPNKPDDDNYDNPPDRNFYQSHITASLSYTQIISVTVSVLLLVLLKHKLPSPQTRIKTSLITSFIFYLTIALFTVVSTDRNLNFAIVILLTVLMNLSSALLIVSLSELVVYFPIRYYIAISSGQVICGILTSLLQIITLSLKVPPPISGAIYFGVGSVIIIGTTVIYWFIHRNSKYFIYRVGQKEIVHEPHKRIWPDKSHLKAAIYKLRWIYATYIIVIATTAIMFPGFCVLISPMEKNNDSAGDWEKTYFVPVITFLGFQSFSFIGREISRFLMMPKKWLFVMIAAILRIGLLPLLLFCNAQPRNYLPVLFGDNAYIAIIFIFGFTEGLLINLSIMAIPAFVDEDEVEVAVILVPLLYFLTTFIFGSLNFLLIYLI